MDKEKYKAYIKWQSQSPSARKPLEVFAKEQDITQEDIEEFKSSEKYQADLITATKKWGRERIPELVHKLYETSKNSGNNKVIESFIDLIKIDEEDEVEDIISITKFSDEQRKQIIDRISGRGGFSRPRSEEEPTDVLTDSGSDLPGELAPRSDSSKTGGSI